MARTRAALTDKQEKIVLQCQLMGMTTADMVKISNRLKALDAEREFRVKVDEVVQGRTWVKNAKDHYTVTDSRGRVYDCKCKRTYDRWSPSEKWNVTVTNPGTRMKPRSFTDKSIYSSYDESARICPDNDKKLYRLLRAIHNGYFD